MALRASTLCKPAVAHSHARRAVILPTRSRTSLRTCALLGPDGKPSSGPAAAKKKFITREEEPEEYWVAKSEKAGANPLKDPLAIIGILAIFFPFIFLAIAAGAGLIDFSVYR